MEDRFLKFVSPEPTTGCWLWNGCALAAGKYGAFKINGKIFPAHRVSWNLFRGLIPNGMFVCHKCDTPACVNPAHLFIGTPQDNMSDMNKKGRGKTARQLGSKNDNSRVTDQQVTEIRNTYVPHHKQFGHRGLAKRFGVSPSAIYRIIHKESWKHVGESLSGR